MPRRPLLLVAALLLAPALAPAADYLDPAGIEAALARAADGDVRATVREIGKSREGRPIRSILLGHPFVVAPADRPRVLVVAGLNADHRVGSTVAALLAERLLKRAKEDEGLRDHLLRGAVEIVPLANPDGLAALLAGPRREGRLDTRPVDRDRDGLVDEDGPEDLDGDGVIAMMRVRDAAGEWRESDEDPRLMVKAKPGETGVWRLLTEGRDDDGDGRFNEDGPGGVDLDRNFAHGWDEPDAETGRSCPSEPETRTLADHVLANPAIACVLVLGHRDSLAKVPAKNAAKERAAPTGPLEEDLGWWKDVRDAVVEIIGNPPETEDPADGAFHQWSYYQRGIPAFATRVLYRRDPEKLLALPSGEPPTTEDGRWLSWIDRERKGAGHLPWRPFEHPQLGAVEIGGFAPGVRTNPPAEMLDDLVDEQVRVVEALLGRLPGVAWEDVSAKELSPGVLEVKATLVSGGVLPVISAMGEKTRAVPPVRVTIDRPADAVLQGKPRELLTRFGRRGDRRRFRWVVRVPAGKLVILRAWTAKAGIAEIGVKP